MDHPMAVRVATHGMLHAERGMTGTDGVILMGDRRTKERLESIAHWLTVPS